MAGKIAIDPRGEIQWKHAQAYVGDQPGQLFVAPDCPIQDPAELINNFYYDKTEFEQIEAGGGHGAVYKTPGNYALKAFTLGGDLGFLRSNVVLAEGLKKVPEAKRYLFSIRGLEIHAAFAPGDLKERRLGDRCFWLMEYVDEPPYDDIEDAPNIGIQRFIYNEALGHYDVPQGAVGYDCGLYDGSLHNLLVEKFDDDYAEYVKIDVAPFGDFFRHY